MQAIACACLFSAENVAPTQSTSRRSPSTTNCSGDALSRPPLNPPQPGDAAMRPPSPAAMAPRQSPQNSLGLRPKTTKTSLVSSSAGTMVYLTFRVLHPRQNYCLRSIFLLSTAIERIAFSFRDLHPRRRLHHSAPFRDFHPRQHSPVVLFRDLHPW